MKNNFYSTLSTEESVTESGVALGLKGMVTFEIESGPLKGVYEPLFHLKYLSEMNVEHQRYVDKLLKPFRKQVDKGTLDPQISIDISVKAFCRVILVNWENVPVREEGLFNQMVEAGQMPVIPYSPENAEELMKSSVELFKILKEMAEDNQNFNVLETKQLAKAGNDSPESLVGSLVVQPQTKIE